MKLRTSFFNATVFRKDITRFTPVWLLYAIGGMLISFGLINGRSPDAYVAMTLGASIGPLAALQVVYALVVAVCLFGDLFNRRMCNAIHALPVRREQLFITHTLAGLLFAFVPNALFAAIFAFRIGTYWYIALLWLLGMMLEYVFFFALAAVCAVSTGSRFAMGAVYYLINSLSSIVHWFLVTFYEPQLPGLHIRSDGLDWFCPAVKLTGMTELILMDEEKAAAAYSSQVAFQGLSPEWWYLGVLAVAAVALLGLGIILYRRRALEKAGEFLVFPKAMPVFSVICTLAVAAMFRIIGELMGIEIPALIVGFLVGCFCTEMLLRRTVKVFDRKTAIKCAAIGGVFALSLFITAADPAQRTQWLPEPDAVESITISDDYDYDPVLEKEYGYSSSMTIKQADQIARLVEIHEQLLTEHTDGTDWWDGRAQALHLTYKLKNGSTVERRYYYKTGSVISDMMTEFYGMPEFILGYEDWDTYLDGLEFIYVESNYAPNFVEVNGAEAVALLEAVKADCNAGAVQQYSVSDNPYYLSISTENDWRTVYIDGDCTNTLAWIKANLDDFE